MTPNWMCDVPPLVNRFEIQSVPVDLDPNAPGVLACAFSGSAQIKIDTMGRLRVEIQVDPSHDWSAVLVKDLRNLRLNWMVYVDDEDVPREIGPEAADDRLRSLEDLAPDTRTDLWDRARRRFMDGS